MASVHIRRITLASGAVRHRVRYRLGGREAEHRHGGSFKTRREAEARARWIADELAAMRVPDMRASAPELVSVRQAAERWRTSRLDISPATANVHRKSLAHILAAFGDRAPESVTPAEVAELVGTLAARLAPSTVRKVRDAGRMVFDHHGVTPNPFRDRRVKLPRDVREEIRPPEAEAVEAVAALLRAALPPAARGARRDRHAGGRVGVAEVGRPRRRLQPLARRPRA